MTTVRVSDTVAAALRRQRPFLAVTLILYLFAQLIYLTATPLQTITLSDNLPQTNNEPQSVLTGIGPDEKEYLVYIRSLSQTGKLPAPAPRYRKSPEEYVSYQAQHPPFFFLLGALVDKVTSGSPAMEWYLLRGLCVIFGALVVYLTAQAAAWAFPDREFVVCAAPALAAFVPMFGHMTANLSNEPMAMALTAWAWLQMVRLVRREAPPTMRDAALLGLTLGAACLTRLTAVMWLPALLLCIWFAAGQKKVKPLPLAAIAGGILIVMLSLWLVRNQSAYGSAIVRTFNRPMLDNGLTLPDYLADTMQPLTIRGQSSPLVITPLYTALWYASTAWFPYWLVQFYLPGFPRGAPAFQALALVADVVLGLLLFLNASRASREKETMGDAGGRVLLWAAGLTLVFCVLALLQQQLYSDWNVVNSPGRYLVAATPASTLLFAFALSTRVKAGPGARIGAIVAAVMMFAFDLSIALLVRQFYADHPTQASVQPIEDLGSGA